jgi:hypothetical protein
MNNYSGAVWWWWWILWIPMFLVLIWGAVAWSSGRSKRRGYFGDYSFDPRDPYSNPSWSDAYLSRSSGRRHRGRGPRGYRRSDSRIQEDISDRLMVDDDIDASDISLEVKDGVVRLTGTVQSRIEKRIAEAIADSVPGVVDVKNELTIGREQARTQQKAV